MRRIRLIIVCLVSTSLSAGNVIACHGFRAHRGRSCHFTTPCHHVVVVERGCAPSCCEAVEVWHVCDDRNVAHGSVEIIDTVDTVVVPTDAETTGLFPAPTSDAPTTRDEPGSQSPVTIRPLAPAPRESTEVPQAPPAPESSSDTAAPVKEEMPDEPLLPKPIVAEPKPSPVQTPTLPTEPEKPATESDPLDDTPEPPAKPEMPKEPAPAKPAPAKEPKPVNDLDDLFGGSAAPAARESAVEAATPPSSVDPEPAKPEADATDSEPATDSPPKEQPAETDPFAVLPTPNEPVRLWVDETGLFEVTGRLVAIGSGSARILKSNGRHTTVPVAKLSEHDRFYVEATATRVAASRGAPADRTAGL